MKTNKFFLFAAMSAVLAFAACNDNNDDNPGVDEPKEVTADVEYSIKGGADMTTLFDLEVTYTDADGTDKQTTAESLPWSKTITGAKVPFTAKFAVNLVAKTEYADKETYSVGIGYGIIYATSDGQQKGSVTYSSMTIAKDKVTNYQNTRENYSDQEPIKKSE